MKKILGIFLSVLVLFFGILVIISERKPSRQIISENPVEVPEVISGFAERLSEAIQIKTVSHSDQIVEDSAAFRSFHQLLHTAFPLVYEKCSLIKINDFALLYILKGNDLNLKPAMLTAHQDVVSAADSMLWEQPPFSGFNDGTFIWGRGALDDKGSLMAILEATELLLQTGFRPNRTLILAFGFDEEINGEFGALALSKYLEENRIYPEFVLDEGLVLTRGVVPMINKPVGLVGIAEKGFLLLKLKVEMEGGHSSMPHHENALTVLSEAIIKLKNHTFKARLCEPVKQFMNYVAPEMNFFPRLVFNNHWFFSPIIKQVYLGFSEGEASVRTTVAPTIFQAGVKDNIIPQTAEAVANFRILPGETIDEIIKATKEAINDARVEISIYEQPFDPPMPSPVSGLGFSTILQSISEEFSGAVAVPYLMLGSSDAKYYYNVCDNIYRFAPYHLTAQDMATLHGINEKISIENYRQMIRFYYRIIFYSCK